MKNKIRIDPWIVCSVLAIYLLPLGLVMAGILTWRETSKHLRKNQRIGYCGIFTVIFSVSMTLYTTVLPSGADSGIFLFIFVPPIFYGIYAICLYILLARRANGVSRLYLLVQQEHITSISQLCQITGLRREQTLRWLELMIRRGMLDGAWIDEKTDTVRFKKSIWARQRFICAYCGAELTVDLGHTLVCEFCGSALCHE